MSAGAGVKICFIKLIRRARASDSGIRADKQPLIHVAAENLFASFRGFTTQEERDVAK